MRIGQINNINSINFRGIEKKDNHNYANIALIGGGGRIGRNVTRQYILAKHAPECVYSTWDALMPIYRKQNLVAINLGSMGLPKDKTINDIDDDSLLTQLTTDSILKPFPEAIKFSITKDDVGNKYLTINSKRGGEEKIKLIATNDTVDLSDVNTDIIVEATGARPNRQALSDFRDKSNAKYIILTAPGKEKDKSVPPMLTVVAGINSEKIDNIDKENGVMSAASCTTTCISPLIKLMDEKFGVESGFIETTHAATQTEFIADRSNKKADSKYRGALDSIFPTTTGAHRAIGLVLPHLKGKLVAKATRVPTTNVSMVTLVLNVKNKTTAEEVKATFENAEKDINYKNLIAKAPKGSCSKDALGRHESALYVPESIDVIDSKHIIIKAYYDNEFGYTRSMMDSTGKIAQRVVNQKQA